MVCQSLLSVQIIPALLVSVHYRAIEAIIFKTDRNNELIVFGQNPLNYVILSQGYERLFELC